MKKIIRRLKYKIDTPPLIALISCLVTFLLMLYSYYAWADSGSDLLAGTDANMWATLNGTGKKYIYIGEGLVALFTYIKTKNVLVLTGILIVAIFFNVMLKMAGASL